MATVTQIICDGCKRSVDSESGNSVVTHKFNYRLRGQKYEVDLCGPCGRELLRRVLGDPEIGLDAAQYVEDNYETRKVPE